MVPQNVQDASITQMFSSALDPGTLPNTAFPKVSNPTNTRVYV